MKALIHQFDTTLTSWIIAVFGAYARPAMLAITTLGDPFVVLFIAAGVVVVAIGQNIRMVLAGLMIPLTLGIGALLKLLFERARPMSDYVAGMRLDTFSFPSGHSNGSMIAYGLLAYIAFSKLPAPWNLISAVLLGAIPLFVGISRVYLGAHFPSDVVAGWLLGGLALAFIVLVIRPLG